MTPLSTDSRCTQGRPVRYSWAGESTVRLDSYKTDIVAAIAAVLHLPDQKQTEATRFSPHRLRAEDRSTNQVRRRTRGEKAKKSNRRYVTGRVTVSFVKINPRVVTS